MVMLSSAVPFPASRASQLTMSSSPVPVSDEKLPLPSEAPEGVGTGVGVGAGAGVGVGVLSGVGVDVGSGVSSGAGVLMGTGVLISAVCVGSALGPAGSDDGAMRTMQNMTTAISSNMNITTYIADLFICVSPFRSF